ncbi:MAG: phosphoribosyltransferase [Gemmatimonadetes bacterium]|nr:phosphoribosyltransferase [Gemmatimonadota bacterium]
MPRIALPNKGRLADDTRELFADAGLDVRVRNERALTASLGGMFDAIFVRAADIPEFVADGAADIGVTGWDLVAESGRDVVSLLDLELGRCRLSLAATDDSGIHTPDDVPQGARVATAFPRLSAEYFAKLGRAVQLVPVSGAAEIAPHLGIADVIVDLVSSGSTLRVNGLREVATVLESSARLVCARATAESLDGASDRARAIVGLVAALESVIRAKGQRYVMANVPRRLLSDVRRILPGLGGPTVVDVLNGGEYVAVHAVVPASDIYQTIGDLRALGATGVLVTRIERLVP